jgi:hypothetical protein
MHFDLISSIWSQGGSMRGNLLPGSSIGPRYVLLLLLVKNHKTAKNSAATEAREKFSIVRILEIF